MANFVNLVKDTQNFTYTENGAGTYSSTMSGILDLFGLGAAYRTRTDAECIRLFDKAFAEDQLLALKCLFYIRDVRGGQGERRFFRVVLKDLASTHPEIVRKNLANIAEYGRYDDLYCLIGTPVERDAFELIKNQLRLDMTCKTPSLLAKWLKSENTSSKESQQLARKTRMYLGITSRDYRKMLSKLRSKINVLEKLMSSRQWDKIEYDKIPSRAGLIYKNAFARRDVERYKEFMESKTTKVNAKTLYPYEVIHQLCINGRIYGLINELDRNIINKYWDNLADYINGAELNALAMVDTSGSMYGTPIEVALSLGMICAERCSGPYHNHFLTFRAKPYMQEIVGRDFVDKVRNLHNANWDGNTNIEAAFDLMLDTAIRHNLAQSEIPAQLLIISDMEFDSCVRGDNYTKANETLMETMTRRWARAGYKMPNLVFWNVNARNDRIPMRSQNGITFVSGFSPVLFEQIIKNKSSWDLVLDKLLSSRYEAITL